MADNDSRAECNRTNDEHLGRLDRRDYLRAIGGVGLASAFGGLSASQAAAETANTSRSVDERIQDHRTGDLEVVVQNSDGSSVSNADISVTQQEHDFGFGTAVNAGTLINNSSPGDNYRTYIPKLFNKAVLENQTKWAFWENNRQLADDAIYWLLDQGLDVRGHVCIWGRADSGAIPSDIQTAIDNRNGQYIRDRAAQHIEDIITHYGDDLTEWEVVNEAMHVFQIQLGVYGDRINQDQPWTGDVVPWTSDLLADWYSKAQSVIDNNGMDLGIAVNDFNQFAYAYTDNRYETEINHISNNGAPLDTVGLQAHVGARTGQFNTNNNPDARISASQVADEINKWADHGARVKITEFDTYGGNDWNSDQERADVLENYLRGAFSHPGVDDFIMWGFWDGRHWKNEAPLFYRDWSKKPAYDVWTGLVYDEWWTDEAGLTDDSGTYSTSAFLGEHEITAETNSDSATTTVSMLNSSGTTTVTLTVDGSGSSDGGDGGSNDESGDGDSGSGDSANLIAEINPSTTSASVGERITFQVIDSSDNGNWIVALSWSFGDGNTGTGWWDAHTYDSPGSYTVELTATDNGGRSSTDTVTINVS